MSPACERWRDAIAVDALGGLEPSERTGLLAHLDGCPACRALAAELRETVTALGAVDRGAVTATAAVPPSLTERVLGTLHDEARSTRRRRRAGVGAAALVAVAAAAALAVALVAPPAARTGGSHTLVLTGDATATAVLSSRPWGTAIELTERGLPAGAVYEVAMRTATGSWWATGSYRGAGPTTVTAQLSCAVPMAQITGIKVTTARGATVLESVAAPGTTW